MTKSDPHAMKLARLQWELAKRKELSEEAEKEEVLPNHFQEKNTSACIKLSSKETIFPICVD